MHLIDFDTKFEGLIHKKGNVIAYPFLEKGDEKLCLLFFNYKNNKYYQVKTRKTKHLENNYKPYDNEFDSPSYYYHQQDKNGHSCKLSFMLPDMGIGWGKNKHPFLSFCWGKHAGSDTYNAYIHFSCNTVGTPRSFMKPLSEAFDVETYDIELRKHIAKLFLSGQTENIILAANMMNLINF